MRAIVRAAVAGGIALIVAALLVVVTGSDPISLRAPAEPPAAGLRLAGSDDRTPDGSDVGSSDDDSSDGEEQVAETGDGQRFALEIDPELDARFGPRPVNGAQAAEIAVQRFGGRVLEAELDEEAGRPVWEIELTGAAADEVVVDAIDGRIR